MTCTGTSWARRPYHRLVLLTSTWGSESLLATQPHLAVRLLSELPADEYRVAAVVHPNFWDHHGHPQLAGWLRPAIRAGLVLIPAEEGWRAALLAADVVVGDHGSVVFYAAALGTPIAYGTFSGAEIPPGSPAAALAASAPHIDTDSPLRPQIDAIVTGHDPAKHLIITGRSLADVDASARLRSVLYREMRLDEPGEPPCVPGFPAPNVESESPTLHHVYLRSQGDSITARRFSAGGADPSMTQDFDARILVVDTREPNVERWRGASVLLWTEDGLRLVDADEWTRNTVREWPSCAIAAAELGDGTVFVRRRDGGRWIVTAPGAETPTIAASIHYRSLTMGGVATFRMTMGQHRTTVFVRPAPVFTSDEW